MTGPQNRVTKSVLELVDARPDVDNRELFDALWSILVELRRKIEARFELRPDPSTADLQPYTAEHGEGKGVLATYSGPEIDWLVHSWVGTPHTSFSNMHLTAWLGPHIRVPHLGMALGTMPDIFVYMDYVPRVDLMVDLAYLDRYYEPANARAIQIAGDPAFTPFFSRSLYMRQSQSHASICAMVKPRPETLGTIRKIGHEMVDRWIGWIDAAEPVPEAERPALAARDLLVRRTIAERDPANAIGVRLFGAPMTERLVRGLWGGDRAGAAPGGRR